MGRQRLPSLMPVVSAPVLRRELYRLRHPLDGIETLSVSVLSVVGRCGSRCFAALALSEISVVSWDKGNVVVQRITYSGRSSYQGNVVAAFRPSAYTK